MRAYRTRPIPLRQRRLNLPPPVASVDAAEMLPDLAGGVRA